MLQCVDMYVPNPVWWNLLSPVTQILQQALCITQCSPLSLSLCCQASFLSWLWQRWPMSDTSEWSMPRWWTSPGRGGLSPTSGCTRWPGQEPLFWDGTATPWRSISWAALWTGCRRTQMMPPSSSCSSWHVSLCLWASWSTAMETSCILFKW